MLKKLNAHVIFVVMLMFHRCSATNFEEEPIRNVSNFTANRDYDDVQFKNRILLPTRELNDSPYTPVKVYPILHNNFVENMVITQIENDTNISGDSIDLNTDEEEIIEIHDMYQHIGNVVVTETENDKNQTDVVTKQNNANYTNLDAATENDTNKNVSRQTKTYAELRSSKTHAPVVHEGPFYLANTSIIPPEYQNQLARTYSPESSVFIDDTSTEIDFRPSLCEKIKISCEIMKNFYRQNRVAIEDLKIKIITSCCCPCIFIFYLPDLFALFLWLIFLIEAIRLCPDNSNCKAMKEARDVSITLAIILFIIRLLLKFQKHQEMKPRKRNDFSNYL